MTALQLAAIAFIWKDSIVADPLNHIDLLFFFIGTIGQFLIVQFALHPEDYVFVILHYIGALSIVFEGLAFGFQQNWNIISFTMNVVSWITFILWQFLKICADDIGCLAKKHDNPKVVKRTSIIIIIPEMISTYLLSLCGVFFVFCMGGEYKIGNQTSVFSYFK